jgi:hypothetical protein
MSKKIVALAVILAALLLSVYIGYYFYINGYFPPTFTLPSPLESVEFPSEPAEYQEDWPDDLIYPTDFVLVDSSSGTLPEDSTKGWSAKLRFQGKSLEALTAITAFFEGKGWTIIDKSSLASGGFTLILQREQGNGIVVIDIDPQHSSQTLIIATLFP